MYIYEDIVLTAITVLSFGPVWVMNLTTFVVVVWPLKVMSR